MVIFSMCEMAVKMNIHVILKEFNLCQMIVTVNLQNIAKITSGNTGQLLIEVLQSSYINILSLHSHEITT